ncbi:MAG: sigma-70 family RNA polymerase sigma factor [Methylococcaceae bacterium]|nr:sigma-70 family RNA polymerase sigma factor [Methylococcaceae bacterium]
MKNRIFWIRDNDRPGASEINQERQSERIGKFNSREPESENDLEIVAAIQAGDRTAFARLYDRHANWLLALAYRILQNRRDAEDLLHDVFIEIWDKANSYDAGRGSVRSWLAVRTRSRALDRIRALTIVRKNETSELNTHATMIEISDTSESGIDQQNARRAVETLSPKQRTVIQLSYFQGMTCQEIADRCQIPIGTVKSRLASALHSLRDYFNPAEDGSPCL